jgi:dTDP-4-dehydrorhamnose reductase
VNARRTLITGATGSLGSYLVRQLAGTGGPLTAWSGTQHAELFGVPVQPVNLAEVDAVAAAFRAARPEVVIHAAAVASVAACCKEPERARVVNTDGSALLADLAAEAGACLLLVSTDLVFDGNKGWYDEQDASNPLSVYARTKVDAERAVLARPRTAVARVSLLFGPTLTGRAAFFDQQVQALRAGRPITCFHDEWRTPLSLAAAARALVALAESDYVGTIHVGGPERLSRLEMGQRLAEYFAVDAGLVVASSREQAAGEPRPRDASLNSARWRGLFPGQKWLSWRESLQAMEPI